jgi:hypothetical protein
VRDTAQRPQRELAPNLTAVFIFLCKATSITDALLTIPDGPFGVGISTLGDLPVKIAVHASPFVFVCASILLFFRHRFGYRMGLAAGPIA